MKKFFAKIGRFFWSWGFLKFILGMIALIIFFYVEEDWRGARAWAATKAEWEAKGETFDYSKFIPPPVPDDQNLAALPLFKLESVKGATSGSYLAPVTLQHAMRDDLPSMDFPSTGNWMRGELPDTAKIQKTLARDFELAFKNEKPPDDMLAQFNAVYPFFTGFLADAVTHPLFRVNQDYAVSAPVNRSLGPVTQQIKLSKILTLHAVLALDHHRSDLALEDIKINYEIASGVKRDPTLVGGLVAIGMAAINDAALYDGLAQHAWNDAQLVELEQTLKPVDFLAGFQFSMRSEAAMATATLDYFHKIAPQSFYGLTGVIKYTLPLPEGWWDDNKSRILTFRMMELSTIDTRTRLVFPRLADEFQHQAQQAEAMWDAFAPWKILAVVSASPMTGATSRFAQAQVWLDETRIACGLERYRLAHGVYPGALEALVPACIDELPHDIMSGRAYRYQLRADGTFLLYSVGWNQTDEGGKVVYKKDAPTQVDYQEGDWVWPTPWAVPAEQGK